MTAKAHGNAQRRETWCEKASTRVSLVDLIPWNNAGFFSALWKQKMFLFKLRGLE